MTLLLKDPEAALDYAVDWGAEYLAVTGDTLAQSDWRVSPTESGGLCVTASRFDQRVANVTATGGVAGHLYQLTNHVVLSSGLTDSRSIVLRVERR
jgi:hypothetical protein